MFVFEMFEPSLIMRLRSVCFSVFFPCTYWREGFFFLFFVPFYNESRWEESVSIPLLLSPSSPSGFDRGVRLCFLLALWFTVVMIYRIRVPGGSFELISFYISGFPPLLFLCVSIDKHFICCHLLWYYWRKAPSIDHPQRSGLHCPSPALWGT